MIRLCNSTADFDVTMGGIVAVEAGEVHGEPSRRPRHSAAFHGSSRRSDFACSCSAHPDSSEMSEQASMRLVRAPKRA